MIKKFLKINYGSYQDFSWDLVQEFQKLNIFYGRNYSGKTILSRILRSFEIKNLHDDYSGSTFEIETNESENSFLTQDNIKVNDLIIRVYNKDFVKDNLGFLIDDKAGDIKAFASVVMGKETIKFKPKYKKYKINLEVSKMIKNIIFLLVVYVRSWRI